MNETGRFPAVPDEPRSDRILDIAAVIGSMVPWLGGPIGAVLSGAVTERRLRRIVEVLQELDAALRGLESHVARQYVQTEDFQDLLAQTLENVARERSEMKRHAYRRFLAAAITTPDAYDDQVELLRTLELLQPEHLRVLAAIAEEPRTDILTALPRKSGVPRKTLERRLGGYVALDITEAVERLNSRLVTKLTGLDDTIPDPNAYEDLRAYLTPFGARLVRFLTDEVTP